MWVVIIIGIVLFIILKFAIDSNKQSRQVQRQGGMQHKYRVLISHIKSGDPRVKIYKGTNSFISLGTSTIGGTTVFDISQTYGRVTIQWKIESPVFGKHNLEWEFEEYHDQDKMMEKITHDLTHYQNNVMTSQDFPEMD